MFICASCSVEAHSQSEKSLKVKAALIYQLSRFMSWPETSFTENDSFNICLINRDPLNGYLHQIENRTHKNKPIKLHVITSKDDIKKCHLVYIEHDPCQHCPTYLSDPILTIGDNEGFAAGFGDIELKLVNNRYQFVINKKNTDSKNINVSAKLLEVAHKVIK